jgi:hypothetical protein
MPSDEHNFFDVTLEVSDIFSKVFLEAILWNLGDLNGGVS